jgi:hypothetical protein
MSGMKEHPFGPVVAAQLELRRIRDEELYPLLAARAREAMKECTGQPDCPSQVHDPSCPR